ncbi:MAG TPA: hypothetical protein V6D29_25390 [Leptolyngbyaceae cyanobacterium]
MKHDNRLPGLASSLGLAVLGIAVWAFPSRSELDEFVQRGPISQSQADQAISQNFPVRYDQVIDLLGSPRWRSQAQDLYQMPDGRWLAISYDGLTAVGVTIREIPIETTLGEEDRWANGVMSWEQFNVLRYLAWPQAGPDMTGTFGSPAYRVSAADYYRLPDGRYAIVWYTLQNQAVGYAVQDLI